MCDLIHAIYATSLGYTLINRLYDHIHLSQAPCCYRASVKHFLNPPPVFFPRLWENTECGDARRKLRGVICPISLPEGQYVCLCVITLQVRFIVFRLKILFSVVLILSVAHFTLPWFNFSHCISWATVWIYLQILRNPCSSYFHVCLGEGKKEEATEVVFIFSFQASKVKIYGNVFSLKYTKLNNNNKKKHP